MPGARLWKTVSVVLLLLGIQSGMPAWGAEGPGQAPGPAQVLQQANAAFRQGNELMERNPDDAAAFYRKALVRYERLVLQGVRNGRLYYNIGNAYYRLNDIGRAILNYRRAAQYIPEDSNLRHNLAHVLSERLDTIEEKQEQKVFRTLFFWHYDFSVSVRLVLFAVFYLVFWLVAGIRLFSSPRPAINWALGVCLLFFSLFLGSLIADRAAAARKNPAVLLDHEVIARKGDGRTYKPSFTEPLHAGTEFHLLEERGAWYHIELADGRRCWVPASSAELVRHETAAD